VVHADPSSVGRGARFAAFETARPARGWNVVGTRSRFRDALWTREFLASVAILQVRSCHRSTYIR